MKNLLSPTVSRGDLRSLNYNKTIIGRALHPGRDYGTLPDPESDGLPLPRSAPSCLVRDPMEPRSPCKGI